MTEIVYFISLLFKNFFIHISHNQNYICKGAETCIFTVGWVFSDHLRCKSFLSPSLLASNITVSLLCLCRRVFLSPPKMFRLGLWLTLLSLPSLNSPSEGIPMVFALWMFWAVFLWVCLLGSGESTDGIAFLRGVVSHIDMSDRELEEFTEKVMKNSKYKSDLRLGVS